MVQGYLLSRPLPPAEFSARLDARAAQRHPCGVAQVAGSPEFRQAQAM